jgi:NDP-sugar pyrophosphorylase family protein
VECWQVVGSSTDLAGIVLAAGLGTRLRPLTRVRPKPLCPVGDRPLVDHALERVAVVTGEIAVNIHHGRAQMEAHLAGRPLHVSVEPDEPLGTAGALGALRGWIDGRAAVVVNGDTWTGAPLTSLLDGWDGERCRLLVAARSEHDVDRARPRLAGAVLPWAAVAGLSAEPTGLWEVLWGAEEAAGRLDWVAVRAPFADCGTPASYLAANLAATGGRSAIGEAAEVSGTVEESVVWPGCRVEAGERLRRAIRYGEGRTVLVR